MTVKTGDTLYLGGSTLTFVEAPMLHWPDSMMTYMSGENILFSNDAFGSYDWGGDIVKNLSVLLEDAGFKLVNEGYKLLWVPDNDQVESLKEYGASFVEQINK